MNITLKSPKINYELNIVNKISILQDLSATGKTILIELTNLYNQNISTIKVKSPYKILVLDDISFNFYKNLDNNIFFIDESSSIINTEEFKDFLYKSENFFIIINRDITLAIPYGIENIYKFYYNPKTNTNSMVNKYSIRDLNKNLNINYSSINKALIEDSKSGFEFYNKILILNCLSSYGNKGIVNYISKQNISNSLIILDSVGYGKYIQQLLNFIDINQNNLLLILTKSFEYLILKSKILGDFDNILDRIALDNINQEKAYYELLVSITNKYADKRYLKNKLKDWYFLENNIKAILAVLKADLDIDLFRYTKNNTIDMLWSDI